MATETEVCNIALGKIGGAGDQESGTGLIASINGSDRISARCKALFPRVRRRVIGDLAKERAPFNETLKYADLGAENADPPKIGGWTFAFNLPADLIFAMRQIDEEFVTSPLSITQRPTEYRFSEIVDGTTKILLTNDLTNEAGDSAFIQYSFDQTNVGVWSEDLIDAVATLLGAELVPTVGAVDERRQEILAEYTTVNIPKAKASNRSVGNNFAHQNTSYKGGRNESLPTV